jgi:hypothetical protein
MLAGYVDLLNTYNFFKFGILNEHRYYKNLTIITITINFFILDYYFKIKNINI